MSVFYVNVENEDVNECKRKDPSNEVIVTETRYNSERDIAYTPMEKTPEGNIALQDVRSAEDVSQKAVNKSFGKIMTKKLQKDANVNYIDLDFKNSRVGEFDHSATMKKESGLVKCELESKYATIDFCKTSALKQISRTKT